MKELEVKDQVRLGLRRSFDLCLSGVKYRLFRSLVTVATVALAVAFLMAMLGQSVMNRSVREAIEEKTAPRRDFAAWIRRLSDPLTDGQVLATLVSGNRDRLAELKTWGSLDGEQMGQLDRVAAREKQYLDYFARLDEGNRVRLLGSNADQGGVIFKVLFTDLGARRSFVETLKGMPVPIDPDLRDGLDEFLDQWRQSQALRQQIIAGHTAVLERLSERLPEGRVMQLLAQADDKTPDMLAKFGFVLGSDHVSQLRHLAELESAAEKLRKLRNIPAVRTVFADWANVKVANVSEKTIYEECDSANRAREITEIANRNQPGAVDISPDFMVEAAKAKLAQAKDAAIEAKVGAEDASGFLGFSRRTMWLILVSFGVCAVGIANAMLMSVTERFREIATMKCLGAMDGFIMLLFVLESCLQGLVGGLAGAALGLLLGLARSWFEFGLLAFAQTPGWALLLCLGISLLAGVVLASLAAVYPAWVASRLAPMEAMRVE